MLHISRSFLLSALWRPHSEQIKFWIAASAKDAGMLSLARDYLHELELSNVLVTLEDGIELVDILQKIKYPLGSHAILFLAKHLEATCGELSPKNVRQLVANARSANGDLNYYEAALQSPSFFTALANCAHSLEKDELIQLAVPFSSFAGQKGSQCKQGASRISQIVAEELTRRLGKSGEAIDFLLFIATQSLPLEAQEWESLRNAIFAQTETLDTEHLVTLLRLIATHRIPNLNSAWGFVVQEALVKIGKLSSGDVCHVILYVIRSGCHVDNALTDQVLENFSEVLPERLLLILTAWREAKLDNRDRDILTASSQKRLLACIEAQVVLTKGSFPSRMSLLWLYCLSFFSAQKTADWMKIMCGDTRALQDLAAEDIALLCKTMINANVCFPRIVDNASKYVESDTVDQEGSIALLYVCQKCGKKAPEKLVKKAIGRFASRLVATHAQGKGSEPNLLSSDLALLLAALSFEDDKERVALLMRLVQLPQVTPAVALIALRYTRDSKSKACHFTQAKLVKKLLGAAHALSAEELSFTMSILVELRIRDAAAFEHLLRMLESKKPSLKDMLIAGQAAKALRLVSTFDQSSMLQSLLEFPDVSSAFLLKVLQCCRMERRRALLSSERMRAVISNVSIADTATSDLVLLFVISAADKIRRASIAQAMDAREPVKRHCVDVDDVINAFECASLAHEIESICRVCTNVTPDLSEMHLMRLLRCAQRYSVIPNKFYRFVGTSILSLASRERLSPNSALLWLKFYSEHRIRDDAVGRCLVMKARRRDPHVSPELSKYLSKAELIYGLEQKKLKHRLKR
jgi:hypothetical protein